MIRNDSCVPDRLTRLGWTRRSVERMVERTRQSVDSTTLYCNTSVHLSTVVSERGEIDVGPHKLHLDSHDAAV